jgi:glycine amidinotransferase
VRVAPAAGGASASLALNVLLLDRERVLVERTQTAMIEALRAWGFEPILVALAGYGALGGSVRRATLDLRRGNPSAVSR